MRIFILAVGENRIDYLGDGESDYLKRIQRYCKIEIMTVKPEKIVKNRSPYQIKETEGKRLLQSVSNHGRVISLDRTGQLLTSDEFAHTIEKWQNEGVSQLTFIIGGALGLSRGVLEKSHLMLSLSPMTFTHEMVRLFLLEQIYRSYTILRGEKYHK